MTTVADSVQHAGSEKFSTVHLIPLFRYTTDKTFRFMVPSTGTVPVNVTYELEFSVPSFHSYREACCPVTYFVEVQIRVNTTMSCSNKLAGVEETLHNLAITIVLYDV